MKPLAAKEIVGTWGTLLLPINRDGTIDYVRLGDEADILAASSLNGVYTGGTAGEFYALTEEEFDRVNVRLAQACEKAKMPFQIGATHTSAHMCLSRAKRAAALRPSAIQVVLPDWVPLSQTEAIDFLQRVAEAVAPVGLVLYNPPHAKRVLKPAEYKEIIAAVPGLVGVKVGGGDRDWYDAMRQHMAELSVFVPGHQLATGYPQGAAGAYSNVACLQPDGAQHWYETMKVDPDRAAQIERRIQAFMVAHILPFSAHGFSNQALDKLLAAIGGWANVGTRLRWPYAGIAQEEADRLRPIAREFLRDLFI